MPLLKLYFTSLLVLACAQVARSVPVVSKGLVTDACVLHAHTLVQNITDMLTQTNLFSGIDCTKQSLQLNMETDTPSVCSPKEPTCSGIVKSEFDQDLCLTSIGKDLHYYYTFLSAQPDPDRVLAPTVLFHLREFMENCFTSSLPTDSTTKEAAANRPSTYDERLSLCKVLKGFQVRGITISRVIAYMNSGEHTK